MNLIKLTIWTIAVVTVFVLAVVAVTILAQSLGLPEVTSSPVIDSIVTLVTG